MTHRFDRTAKETLSKATRLFIARETLLRTFRKAVRCLSVPVPYKKRTYLPSLQDNIIKVWDVHTPPTVSPFPRIVLSQQYMMDASLLASATTTAAAHTIAVATSTTVVATMARSGQRNGTHRGAVNVHGRLMYDEIVINDVWINAILSTLALSCAACVCLCFLYCKIQQWKHGVQRRRNEKNSRKYDADSLPSYTIVTGLPTYDEAVERMNGGHNYGGGASSIRDNKPPSKHVSVSVVHVRDDLPTPPKPDPKFGLVSHSLFVHDDGCSHCLSVQELLETYNVR